MHNLVLYRAQQVGLGNYDIRDIVDAIGEKYVIDGSIHLCNLVDTSHSGVEFDRDFTIVSELVHLRMAGMLWIAQQNQVLYIPQDLSDIYKVPLKTPILAAKWDSDQYFLATYNINGHVVCYQVTTDETRLAQISDSYSDEKLADSAYVGWGSADTQFRGQGQRASKVVNSGKQQYQCKDPSIIIDWCANQEMFAVGYFDGHERQIKVYDKDCVLYFKSTTTLPGMKVPLAYKPNSNTIVTVRSTDGQDQKLTFVEKNGEIQMEIVLRDQIPIKSIKWSTSGSCFALHYESDEKSFIDLYIQSNTSWNHKQRIPIKNPLIRFEFKDIVEVNCYHLTLYLEKEQIDLMFLKKVSRGYDEHRMAYIIKGRNVHAFMPSEEIIPAGMDIAAYQVEHEEPANTIVVDSNKNKAAIITCDNTVQIYDYSDPMNWKQINTFNLEHCNLIHNCYFKDDNLYFTSITEKGLKQQKQYDLNSTISNCATAVSTDAFNIPIMNEYNVSVEDTIFKIQLNSLNVLKINDVVIKGRITSLYVFNEFILLTGIPPSSTSSHQLMSMKIVKSALNDLIKGQDIFEVDFMYRRFLELSGTIITAIPNSSKVVVQYTRGSIECIELRMITLKVLDEMLRSHKYLDAAVYMQYEAYELDLLFEIQPTSLINHLPEAFQQFKNPFIFNRLLIDLADDSTLTEQDLKYLNIKSDPKKRENICNGIINTILRMKWPVPYMSTLAIANLCIIPDDYNITGALQSIINLNTLESYNDYLEETILALNQYVPFDDLFDAALELYDLDMAEFIGKASTMDPKVYTSFLKKLRGLDELSRRFEICSYRNNFECATAYLLFMQRDSLVSKSKLLEYAIDNKCVETLYLNIDKDDSEIFTDVTKMYADYLNNNSRHLDAGTALCNANLFEDAYLSYNAGMHWQEAIIAIYRTDPETRSTKFRNIVSKLQEHRMYLEASIVCFEHCFDVEEGLQCLVDGRHFYTAYVTALAKNNVNFLESSIVPNMLDYYEIIDDRIGEVSSTFIEKYNQLALFRKNVMRMESADMETEWDHPIENDLFSDAGSLATTTSRKTSISSQSEVRRRRKEERKFKNDKKGSKYEDIALLFRLHELVTEAFNLTGTVEDICKVLRTNVKSCNGSHIKHIVGKLSSIQKCMLELCKNIWTTELAEYSGPGQDQAPSNLEYLEYRYRVIPDIAKQANIVTIPLY